MPLNVRSIAVVTAVICFFAISFIGWLNGLSSAVCCKRALIGSVLAYIAALWTVRAINAILLNAIITNQMQKEQTEQQGKTSAD